jgi:hypothetical protein
LENRRVERVLLEERGTPCTHKWKNETCRNYSRNGVKSGDKGEQGGGEFKYDKFDTL